MDDQNTQPTEPAADAPAAEPQIDELGTARQLAADNMAGWQRANADYANLKREAEMKLAEISKYAVANFVEKLLPVVESFRKASDTRPNDAADATRVASWVDGIVQIRSQLESTLAAAGITAITEANVPFNPTMHEAMLNETREGVAPGTVLAVLEPGWKIHERVIRPAKVTVAE